MIPICVDIDNIVAQTDEVMREVIRDFSTDKVHLGYDDVVCFDYRLCRDKVGRRIEKDEWEKIHEEFTRNHLLRIRPLDGVREHLKTISKNFEIHLATSRLAGSHQYTLQWLEKHKIPYHDLHHVRSGEKHLIPVRFVASFEDDREQAYAFYTKGIRSFLLAHPWNHVEKFSPLLRVEGWKDFIRKLQTFVF